MVGALASFFHAGWGDDLCILINGSNRDALTRMAGMLLAAEHVICSHGTGYGLGETLAGLLTDVGG